MCFCPDKIWVDLSRHADVFRFIELASKCEDDVVVKSGHFAVDGKSLLAMRTISLTSPVEVDFYGNIPDEIRENLKKFIIT